MGLARAYSPVLHFDDINGRPLVGGKLYTYAAGTSTPATTYRDKDGSEANTNPILLNERGECVVWLNDKRSYKFVLKDALDNTIWDADNVSIPASSGGGGVGVQADWTENDSDDPSYIQNKPTLATVATTGNYSDLTGKPKIPAEQVNSDWSAQYGKAQILNKPITMPNATGGLRKTLDADDISNGYVEFKISTGGSYTGNTSFTNPAFVLLGSLTQLRYNSGDAGNYIDTAEVGLYSEGIVGKYVKYYENSHAELVADSAKGWGVSGWWALSKDKYLSVYVRLTLTSSATTGNEVFCNFTSGIFGTGLFQY